MQCRSHCANGSIPEGERRGSIPLSRHRSPTTQAHNGLCIRSSPYQVSGTFSLALRWTQVDRVLGKIRFKQAKTGKRLAVKITDAVNAVLEKCHDLCPTGEYVITRRDGNRYSSDGFRAIWQRHQRKWKRDGFERFTYHDLRAKAAGDCKTIEEAMLLLGHQNISMTRRVYDRIEREVSPTR
jgi:integrase